MRGEKAVSWGTDPKINLDVGQDEYTTVLVDICTMKISTLFPPAAAVLLLFSSAVIQSATACGISWSPTVEDALRGAVLTQRLAVVVFTGSDWSAGSLKLDRDVLMNPEFGDFFVDSFVLVNADFPQRLEIPAPQLEE